ncbi:MAG: DUF6455 family protein [Gemmobacter sp.]
MAVVFGYSESPRAYFTAQGMARVGGVTLARAVVDGMLSRGELAQIVTRCLGCPHKGDCDAWLSSPRSESVPAFCAIKADLDALAAFG